MTGCGAQKFKAVQLVQISCLATSAGTAWGDDKEVSCIDSETGEWDEKYYNLPGNGQHGLDINGWLAYRRKPEEEPHE